VIFAGEVQGLRIMFFLVIVLLSCFHFDFQRCLNLLFTSIKLYYSIQFCELTCYKIELVDILIAVERQVDSISSIFNDGNKFTINKSYTRSKKVKSGLSMTEFWNIEFPKWNTNGNKNPWVKILLYMVCCYCLVPSVLWQSKIHILSLYLSRNTDFQRCLNLLFTSIKLYYSIQFCELTCYKIELVDILIAVERQVSTINNFIIYNGKLI
jgi:hypothetical protein